MCLGEFYCRFALQITKLSGDRAASRHPTRPQNGDFLIPRSGSRTDPCRCCGCPHDPRGAHMEGPVVCGATDITRIVCILSIALAMINDDPGPRTAAVHSPGRPRVRPRAPPARALRFPNGFLLGGAWCAASPGVQFRYIDTRAMPTRLPTRHHRGHSHAKLK